MVTTKYPGMETTWQERPGFCSWLGHPKKDIEPPWFDYGYGSVRAKYPDSDTIKKMITISLSLKARVRGDDFEYYDETYFTNGGHPLTKLSMPSDQGNQVDDKTKKP